MADTTVKAIIEVQAKTDAASRGMKELANSIAQVGEKAEKGDGAILRMAKAAVEGFGKFGLALDGVQKTFGLLNGAIDTALSENRRGQMERMLPTGTVDRYRESVDKMISRNDILRLSIKGLSGDFKLTDGEMQKVLKAAVALEQRGFGPAADNAEKLLDALAKGVNKLDDFGINLEKTKDRQADVNAAMQKFDQIISDTPVDEQTKSLTELKDSLLEIAHAIEGVVTITAKGIAWIAREWNEYAADIWGADYARLKHQTDIDAGLVAKRAGKNFREDIENAELYDPNRNSMGGVPYMARHGSNETYAAAVMGSMGTPGTSTAWAYGSAVEKAKAKHAGAIPVVVVGGSLFEEGRGIEGSLGGDIANRLPVGTPEEGLTFQRLGGLNQLRYGGQAFHGGAEGQALFAQTQGGYDPSNPLGSISKRLTDEYGFGGGGAFDAGAAGMLAGIDALVSGQEAVGKSIAKASATALKAKAVEWGAFAIGELAWGIAESAVFSPTAAGHFAAAAKFGVAAAAAGLGASALGSLAGGGGGGAGNYGAAGGGYASPTGGSQGKGGGGDTFVINLGDGFYGDHAALADAVANGVRQGKRRGARSEDYSANYSG